MQRDVGGSQSAMAPTMKGAFAAGAAGGHVPDAWHAGNEWCAQRSRGPGTSEPMGLLVLWTARATADRATKIQPAKGVVRLWKRHE